VGAKKVAALKKRRKRQRKLRRRKKKSRLSHLLRSWMRQNWPLLQNPRARIHLMPSPRGELTAYCLMWQLEVIGWHLALQYHCSLLCCKGVRHVYNHNRMLCRDVLVAVTMINGITPCVIPQKIFIIITNKMLVDILD
jgi:hypothetical protein